MDQGFKIIYDCKVSSKLAWDTQKPVSKTKKPKVSVIHSRACLPIESVGQDPTGFL